MARITETETRRTQNGRPRVRYRGETLVTLAEEVRDRRFQGGERSFGMVEGKVRAVLNDALGARLPEGAWGRARDETARRFLGAPSSSGS